ncbi:MAG: hypothetical protein AAFS10_03065, partial [Myxococcota bacterium]
MCRKPTHHQPLRFTVALMLCGLLLACSDSDNSGSTVSDAGTDGASTADDVVPKQPTFEGGGPELRYDPSGGDLLHYPDDAYTVPDSSTRTGLRVDINAERIPAIDAYPPLLRSVFDGLDTLDGFGTSAGALLSFQGPLDRQTVPSGIATTDPNSPVIMGALNPEGQFVRIPVEVDFLDDDQSLIVRPMEPLPPSSRAAVGLKRGILGTEGRSIEANALMRSLLQGSPTDTSLDPLVPRVQEMTDALKAHGAIADPEELAALFVFTTQSVVDESMAVAEWIAGQTFDVVSNEGCEPRLKFMECNLTFAAPNFRASGQLQVPEPGAEVPTYLLPVKVTLPLEGSETPSPTVIFGHALTGDRNQSQELAARLPPGWVTIAIDAPHHGDHPLGMGASGPVVSLLNFFALGANGGIDSIALRDNWRQATFDKLALLKLITDGLDVDQNGQPDIDPEQLVYVGVSLGGIMASEFLALAPTIRAAGLVVPGAPITDIVQFGEAFQPLIDLVKPPDATDDDLARLWPIMQTIVERGDAVNYAPHLLTPGRLRGGEPVQLIMAMAIDDAVIPNTSSLALVRAAQLPALEPLFVDPVTTPYSGVPPVSGNIAQNMATAGVFQFKWIYASGSWIRAAHENLALSDVSVELLTHFIATWVNTGTGTIIDPFTLYGVQQR